MDEERVEKICPMCGRVFHLGYDGFTVYPDGGDALELCDECAGVQRDAAGCIANPAEIFEKWEPGSEYLGRVPLEPEQTAVQ